MFQSHVIEIDGIFAGAAVDASGQFRFVAVDSKVEGLEGYVWPNLHDLRRAVGHMMVTGRKPASLLPRQTTATMLIPA